MRYKGAVPLGATKKTSPGPETPRARFLSGYPFELDAFQLEAMDALDGGHSVVVAAPTGSGKTVVAEYAVARALAEGSKAFYTTPLKALSNQKFADFTRKYGPAKVGLLTGDNSINGEAPVVVMTTEVLRNMIYAGSSSLETLRYVVLDEVHYLQDPYRGPVWEEVIIHLPPEVDLVCLSATVSNAEELADWVGTVRGSTRAIIEERRPVPLHNLFLVGERQSERLLLLPTFVDERPNPRGMAITSKVEGGWRAYRRGGLFSPRRSETVELLAEEALLPAIYFIFSRAGCDEAVRQCVREGRRFTSAAERHQIRGMAEAATGHLSDADLSALGYGEWLSSLEAGFAAHHAGLVPPFKEAVERCFLAGLVKVVFATETLSLGINMPARSVVVEKLAKFSGERVEPLTPGEYTQLTGRAGRRGTDDVGYAVVLWSPGVTFDQVASLAGARSYTLTSSFRPTYNMASNLVRRSTPSQAHHLLNLSFAQYRADADIVRLERYLERSRHELDKALEEARCERGDVFEYRRVTAGAHHRPPPHRAKPAEIVTAMEGLRPGDVLLVPARKPGGARTNDRVVVLSTRQRKKGDLSVRAITAGRRLVSFAPKDFHSPPRVVARLELPVPFAPTTREFQRRVASSLANTGGGHRVKEDDRLPDGAAHRPPCSRLPRCPRPFEGGRDRRAPLPPSRKTGEPSATTDGFAGEAVRQGPAVARALGLCEGLVPHSRRVSFGQGLPRARPPCHRVRRAGRPERAEPGRNGRTGVCVHLRAAWSGHGRRGGGPAPGPDVRTLDGGAGGGSGAEPRRTGTRPGQDQASRRRFLHPGRRLGQGSGAGGAAGAARPGGGPPAPGRGYFGR